MNFLYSRWIQSILTIILINVNIVQAESQISEALVFEWWDNGIIDSDEAREMLDLLEEENMQEACLLAEVYALESCATTKNKDTHNTDKKAISKKKVASTKKDKRPSLVPYGYAEWSGRTDSLGHLESQRTELQLHFYRYTLRLGSQSLLTYNNVGSEAYFGQISTKELHSVIPLDTLWGTAAVYPLGMFRAGALLDTARTTQASISITPNKGFDFQLAYWHHQHPADSTERHSFTVQAKGNWGDLAAWWIPENKSDIPLFKFQIHHREKMEYATLAWKASAYLHGEHLPQEVLVSSTIAGSRFWGSQTFAVTAADSWKSSFSINARTIIPLEGDSSKTRFKVMTETGPQYLRGGASAACLQAEERCRQNDLALKISSTWDIENGIASKSSAQERLTFIGKIRTRHTQGQGFGTPLYEAGAAYSPNAFNSAGVALTIPKGLPSRELRIRNTIEAGTDLFLLSLAVTFRRTAEETFHPLHAAMKARINF